MNISQFVQIIKARKWVGIAAFGTVVLATAATTVLMQKQYMAEAALAVDVKAADPVTGSPVQGYLGPQFHGYPGRHHSKPERGAESGRRAGAYRHSGAA